MNGASSTYEALCTRLQSRPSKDDIMEIATEAVHDAALLDGLLHLMLVGDAPLGWRAAWAIDKVSLRRPSLLMRWRREIVECAMSDGVTDGFRRLALSILYNLPDEEVLDVAFFNFLLEKMSDLQSPPGLQALSMKLAFRMSRVDDDLREEFLCILRNMYAEYYSSGVVSVMRKCLRNQKKKYE